MKNYYLISLFLLLIVLPFSRCSKPIKQEVRKPALLITLRTDSGKAFVGTSVRLYKNANDTGITKISDSTGVVTYFDLEPTLYYWLAGKGCLNNRISQTTLNEPLIPNVIRYGYSVLAENGALKIINNSNEPYKLSDSLFNITVKKDTPYIAYRRVRSYLVHTSKLSTPGVVKDTLIRIKCGDTCFLKLPF